MGDLGLGIRIHFGSCIENLGVKSLQNDAQLPHIKTLLLTMGKWGCSVGFIQSLRAFRRPMHAWMMWIAVGTRRMKDALWMNVKQRIVSCDYKYYASRLTAVLMF